MTDEVMQNMQEAVNQSPDNVPLRKSFATMLFDKHLYAEAEEQYRFILSSNPEDESVKIKLAWTFYSLGKVSEALILCEEFELKGISNPSILHLHAKILHQLEKYSAAGQKFAEAREIDSKLDDPLFKSLNNAVSQEEERELSVEYVQGDPDGSFVPYVENGGCSFTDVGGMDIVKEEIRLKIIHPLGNPDIYAAYGKKIGGGILMYGPPGCGKTLLARATAGEVNASFIDVSISDVLDMYTGVSEKNLHDLFETARIKSPSVLFFDEVDALGASRRDMRQSAGRQTINQFLMELDGTSNTNEGVLVLAATNAPWHLDGAFRRPGRFDRIIFVPPPDSEAREAILRILIKGKPVADIDTHAIVKKTREFSGADLKSVVDIAVEAKLTTAMSSKTVEPITTKDLLKALKKVKPSTREWFKTARNHALFANESGLYDDVLAYLDKR